MTVIHLHLSCEASFSQFNKFFDFTTKIGVSSFSTNIEQSDIPWWGQVTRGLCGLHAWVCKGHVFPSTHLWHTTFSDTAWSFGLSYRKRSHTLPLLYFPLLLPLLSVRIPPLNNALFSSSQRGDSRKHWNLTPLCMYMCAMLCAHTASPCGKILSSTLPSPLPSLLPPHAHTLKHRFEMPTNSPECIKEYSQGHCSGLSEAETHSADWASLTTADTHSLTENKIICILCQLFKSSAVLFSQFNWRCCPGLDKPCSLLHNSYTPGPVWECVWVCLCVSLLLLSPMVTWFKAGLF